MKFSVKIPLSWIEITGRRMFCRKATDHRIRSAITFEVGSPTSTEDETNYILLECDDRDTLVKFLVDESNQTGEIERTRLMVAGHNHANIVLDHFWSANITPGPTKKYPPTHDGVIQWCADAANLISAGHIGTLSATRAKIIRNVLISALYTRFVDEVSDMDIDARTDLLWDWARNGTQGYLQMTDKALMEETLSSLKQYSCSDVTYLFGMPQRFQIDECGFTDDLVEDEDISAEENGFTDISDSTSSSASSTSSGDEEPIIGEEPTAS
jgi:hypothetical protein